MSTPLGSMHIELGLDTSKFANNLYASKRAVNYFSAEARAMDVVLKNGGKNLAALESKHKSLGRAFEMQGKVLATLKKQFDELEPGTAEWEKAAVEIQKHNVKLEHLRGQLNQVEEAIRKVHIENSKWGQASAALTQFGDKATKLGEKWKKAGDKISGVGNTLTKGVTAPLLTGAGLAVKSAIDFESAFAGVKKTVDETATVSYDKLSRSIRDMSKELPASAAEIANVAEAAGQLGVPAGAILGFTKNMINLGESTNMSSEEAAMSIAKIGNIMGFTGEKLDGFSTQFGATVVRLGNNFATTESDVTAMTNRLAAAGRIAGLTTPQVMGLATSMSSVGIEAEAGGTAMSQTLTAISKAVSESGEDLSLYAETAGMTAEEFAEAWKTKPAEAIQAFIKGLGESEAKGKDLNKILDDLGLKGVRQSGMLKSLGLAAETMGGAMKLAGEEWESSLGKTNALTEEAGKRYETTESKLKMLRNEATDVAIEFGGPLVDALRDGLEAAKPLIKGAGDLAKAFSEMDKEQQQQIINWALIAGAAGPALSILGKGASGIGSLIKMVGGASKGLGQFAGWIGKLRAAKSLAGDLGAASAGIDAIGVAASGASGATTALTGAATALGSVPLWGILAGGAAIVGLGIYAAKAGEAYQRTQEWGAAVSKTEAEDLSKLKTKVDETNKAMLEFGSGAGEVEKVKKAFDDLAGSVTTLLDEKLAKDIDMAEKLGLSEDFINGLKSRSKQVVDNINGMNEQVKAIYERHKGDMSQLTQAEKELVLRNQNEMVKAQLDLMDFSAKEKKALMAALNGELDQLNMKQLDKALKNTNDMLSEENKSYKTKKAELKEFLTQFGNDTSKLNEQELANYKEAKAALDALEGEHLLKKQAYNDQWLNIQRERVEKLRSSGKDEQLIQFELAAITNQLAKEMGISYEEASKLLSQSVDVSTEKLDVLSNQTAKASKEVAAANSEWDKLFTSANPQESLNNLLSTAEGWNSFEIMVKNADVNPAGRNALAEMLVAGGQWQNMSMDQKKLVVDGQMAMIEIFDSKEKLAEWQALTPEQKKLMAEDLTANPTKSATDALNSVKQAVPAEIKAEDKTAPAKESAQASVDSPKQTSPVSMLGRDDTGPSVASVNQSVNSPRQASPVSMLGRNDTGPAVAQANAAVNSPRQAAPTAINAVNNASGPAQQATRDLDNVPRSITSTITTFVQKIFKNEKGTDFHPGGLAMVNDQRGPLYKELVTLPTGESFIPQGRDVILPLPRGSKVLTASRTKAFMSKLGVPKYAEGVGYSVNSPFIQSLDRAEKRLNQQVVVQQKDGETVGLLKAILAELKQPKQGQLALDVSGQLSLDNPDYRQIAEVVGRMLAQEMQRQAQLKGVSM